MEIASQNKGSTGPATGGSTIAQRALAKAAAIQKAAQAALGRNQNPDVYRQRDEGVQSPKPTSETAPSEPAAATVPAGHDQPAPQDGAPGAGDAAAASDTAGEDANVAAPKIKSANGHAPEALAELLAAKAAQTDSAGDGAPVAPVQTGLADATITPTAFCLNDALSYAADRGWIIFPAVRDQKKSHKAAEHSGGVRWGSTKDPAQIRADFKRWPDAGIGLPTGADNGIFVVEADTMEGHGVDGIANLAELKRQHGKLPDTLMAESPSGSVHRYYRHPGNGIYVKNADGVLAPGVDVKGDGGMVIAPPSRRGDGVYRWLNNAPITSAPDWLLALVLAEVAPKRSNVIEWNFKKLPPRQSKPELFTAEYQAEIGNVHEEKPPVDPRPILKGCPFFSNATLTGGKDHQQGLWMQVGLATTFMEHGREVFHALSKGDARYDRDNVDRMFDRKLAEREEKDIGYPSCKALKIPVPHNARPARSRERCGRH